MKQNLLQIEISLPALLKWGKPDSGVAGFLFFGARDE
jgi:hypothetical protein